MKRWRHPRLALLPIGLGLLLGLAATWQAALGFPNPTQPFLSKMPNGQTYQLSSPGDATATNYYNTINAPLTFAAWKAAYGFGGAGNTRAVYFNGGDLGFGRDMNCRRNGQDVACYVANHGFGPGGPADQAVADVIAGRRALPIVAMVFDYAAWNNAQPNRVKFYIYDNNGSRLNKVALDSGGDKYLPQLCLPCHGGYYYTASSDVYVDSANFLPFDTASFKYSTQPGYTLADQAEKFRQLNAMVRDTQPYPLVSELIDGWYNGQVNQPGQPFNANFVPASYAAPADTALYLNVVKPYCRTCHLVMPLLQFSGPGDFDSFNYGASIRYDVYSSFLMPHAEVTSHNFWTSSAPAFLASNRAAAPTSGWDPFVWRVSQTADRSPSGCVAGNCALRDAVVDASSNPGLNIIVFDVDGTFPLDVANTPGGVDLLEGDLDLAGTIVLLGNGADKTIIDGQALDRVFHIHTGANVIIQGVTIEGGQTGGNGGGLFVEGGALVLNDSVVKNNSSTLDGAGLAIQNGGAAEINRSTLGPGNSTAAGGGGVFNGGSSSRAVLNNSTVSGNTAASGGGLYNLGASAVMTVTQSTITGNTAASVGGGVRNSGGAARVQSSLVAGNSGTSSSDCASATSLGHNLFGQAGSANGCPVGGSDLVPAGSLSSILSTQLSGGPLPVHALNPVGPAVDAVPLGSGCALPSFDEHNQPRPVDGNLDGVFACDIGAVESSVPPQRVFLPVVTR